MKLINFESTESYSVNINKKELRPVPHPILGTINEWVDSGVLDHTETHSAQYWIPIDRIEVLREKKGHFYINDIEVDEKNFKKVVKILENEV